MCVSAVPASDILSYPSKYADVNAFLVLAATRNKSTKSEDPADPNRVEKIITAATAGHVHVQLVSSKVNLTRSISNRSDHSQISPTRIHCIPSPMMPILLTYWHYLLKVPIGVWNLTPQRPDHGLILTSTYQVTGFPN